jgi:dihydrofolate reductase
MRRFKLQVQTTVDGYMAGPKGEMDWTTADWTSDVEAYVSALTEQVDGIVLGRKLAEGFIPAWAAGPEGEDQAAIDWMNTTPKVVISRTLTDSPWENAIVVGGELTEAVHELKARPGGDLITYGGSTLATALIAEGLLDELHLFVNPVAIGIGMRVFANSEAYERLRLVDAQPFDCGIIAMHYQPAST